MSIERIITAEFEKIMHNLKHKTHTVRYNLQSVYAHNDNEEIIAFIRVNLFLEGCCYQIMDCSLPDLKKYPNVLLAQIIASTERYTELFENPDPRIEFDIHFEKPTVDVIHLSHDISKRAIFAREALNKINSAIRQIAIKAQTQQLHNQHNHYPEYLIILLGVGCVLSPETTNWHQFNYPLKNQIPLNVSLYLSTLLRFTDELNLLITDKIQIKFGLSYPIHPQLSYQQQKANHFTPLLTDNDEISKRILIQENASQETPTTSPDIRITPSLTSNQYSTLRFYAQPKSQNSTPMNTESLCKARSTWV